MTFCGPLLPDHQFCDTSPLGSLFYVWFFFLNALKIPLCLLVTLPTASALPVTNVFPSSLAGK